MHLATFGLGDAAALQAQVDSWNATLRGLNTALALARQTGNVQMEAQVRAGITYVLQQLVSLNEQIKGQEMPSEFMQKLASFADDALKVAADVGGVSKDLLHSASGIASGASLTLKFLPFLLMGALVVIGLGFAKGGLKIERRY